MIKLKPFYNRLIEIDSTSELVLVIDIYLNMIQEPSLPRSLILLMKKYITDHWDEFEKFISNPDSKDGD